MDRLIPVAVGVVVLVASVVPALGDEIPRWERGVFRRINRLPNWLFPVLWAPMQLGNLAVGTVAGLAVSWGFRDWTMAAGVGVAAGLKLVSEKIVRREMASHLEVRQRPGTSQEDAILRGGDVPSSGPSFPSGHVILVAAVATVVTDDLATPIAWVPALLTALVMLGRVYVGARNPLDATAGLSVGLIVGSVADLI